MWKSFWKRQPYASMIVSSRIVKPHIVKKWATPGMVHFKSFRCPATSVSSASALREDAASYPVGRRLTGPDQPGQPVEPPAGDGQRDDGDGQSDSDPDGHCSSSSSGSG